MGSLLFGVQPADPLTYGVVFGLVLFTATLAAYLPAWRAAMLDPAETLRTQ
jgi:putative ABC transport system permease protein